MASPEEMRARRLDDAARAAWYYFVAGNTQDEIAVKLELSRQAVQRLVALAVSERLINFRLNHPIASCMALASKLTERYSLNFCDVTLSDLSNLGSVASVAMAVAVRIERLLCVQTPTIICVGTGRTMRAAVDCMEAATQPQHTIVSLVGNMASDGHASPYDVVMRLADRIGAQRYPLPAPVVTDTVADKRALQAQRAFCVLMDHRQKAKASFVGVSEIAWHAPIHVDGFMTDADIKSLLSQGAVGEITGWSFDARGRVLAGSVNDRVASLPLEQPPARLTVMAACGERKLIAIKTALQGGLVNALITDEATAAALLTN